MSFNSIADLTASFLVRKNIVQQKKQEIYAYGFELIIATILNGICVLVAALVMGVVPETVLMLVPFMLLRTNAGGFHAKSHAGCIVGFTLVYVFGVIAVKNIPGHAAIPYISLIFSSMVVLFIGALAHQNRPVTDKEYKYFKRKARIISVILLFVGLTGQFLLPAFFIYYALGMLIAAGSLLFGYLKNKAERRREHVCG